MRDWAEVVATGCALPGVEQGSSDGRAALRFRGKTLAGTAAPDPATFWETDQYRGWLVVLVRYGTDAGDQIAMPLRRTWWDRATIAQRRAWGGRP